jgi:PPK2 family polyphosphate:nucleotide phosphotransferase
LAPQATPATTLKCYNTEFPDGPFLHYNLCISMKPDKYLKQARNIAEQYRISQGKKFRLKRCDPNDTHPIKSKDQAAKLLEHGSALLCDMQAKLFAQDKWALLVIFQAMDAAGKDGAIKHVMSGINPQGCDVTAFKVPSPEELDHDYLWRAHKALPERGKIGIFNRSYYEEVLVVRVHRGLLQPERLPEKLVHKGMWEQRYREINHFERYLTDNGVVIRKFFLHLSKEEQKKRFLSRLEDPQKNWKFSMADIKERGYWDKYQETYEEMIQETASKQAPWYVVPADNKWFTRLVISAAIVETLDSLKLDYPTVDKAKKKELAKVREQLEREKR